MQRKVASKFNSVNSTEDLVTGISISQEKLSNCEMTNNNNDKQLSLQDRCKQSFFFDDDIIGQRYTEASKLPVIKHIPGIKINWKKTHNVIELPILGYFRTYEKRVERSCPNPWRRHGALVKIYEIGGWITKIEKQQISRRERKYFYVKPGTKPCNPPLRPAISIRDSKFLPPSSINLAKTTKNESIEELAFTAAIRIQGAIQNSISVFLESHQNETTKCKKNDENCQSNEKIKSSGRSSSAQCLPNQQQSMLSQQNSRSRSLSLFSQKLR